VSSGVATPSLALAPPNRRARWGVVGLLWLAVLINYIDRGALSIVAVPLMKEFGLSPSQMGTLLSSFFWTYSIMQIPAGWVVDRYGLKWTYAGAFLIWSLASAATGLASSFGAILCFRLLLGVGEAAAQPVSLAYIRRKFREDERGMPTAIYLTGMSVGPAAGTALGAMLLDRSDWRTMFMILGLGCCIWLLPWLALAPSKRVLDGKQEARQPRDVDWRGLLRNRLPWGILVGGFLYSYYWYFCLTWLPPYLMMERKMSVLEMGIFSSLPFLAKVPMATAAGKLSDILTARYGRPILVRKLFIVVGFTLGSSILLLHVVHTQVGVVGVLISSLFGIALAAPNYWTLTQAVTPAHLVGRVIGAQNTIGNCAGVCAPIVTGWLVERSGSFDTAIWFAGLALPIAAIAYLTLVREDDAAQLQAMFPEPDDEAAVG
jgi:MFS transporter, ACS family, D-galactonate transporter